MGTPVPSEPWDLPAEDDVAETLLHLLIRVLLLEVARRWLADRGVRALVGSDQFVYWDRRNPHRVLAPDLYVVLGEDPNRSVRIWKTWEDPVPDLAVEVVSDDIHKDYVLGPTRYAALGVRELVVFDPLASDEHGRVTFQVYRRDEAGALAHVQSTDADRVWSEVLGCWLRRVTDPSTGEPRLRLATGRDGDTLVQTAAEAEHAHRGQMEAERAQKEAEQTENALLRQEIERLREELTRKP